MENFAFIIHPLDPRRDVARRYPALAQMLPAPLIRLLARLWPPLVLSQVVGVRSEQSGKRAEGWLLACPLTAVQMLELPPQAVYDKIVQTGRLAQKQGARILGLGAFTSVVGDGGVTIAQRLNMPVTTGNSLTVGLAVESLTMAADQLGLAMETATAAVVGASGSIGLGCAELLAPLVESLILVGRREIHLSQARAQAEAAGAAKVRMSIDVSAVSEADLVVSATSASQPVLYPRHLKRNALVCDIALPTDVAPAVRQERRDVTLIQGGVVEVPGPADLGFDFGLSPGLAYACMAEAMVLALEGRYESFSLGQKVYPEKVHEITQLAHGHGFRLSAPFASTERQDT
jgi:predicted amino acid dehydrogenase